MDCETSFSATVLNPNECNGDAVILRKLELFGEQKAVYIGSDDTASV